MFKFVVIVRSPSNRKHPLTPEDRDFIRHKSRFHLYIDRQEGLGQVVRSCHRARVKKI